MAEVGEDPELWHVKGEPEPVMAAVVVEDTEV